MPETKAQAKQREVNANINAAIRAAGGRGRATIPPSMSETSKKVRNFLYGRGIPNSYTMDYFTEEIIEAYDSDGNQIIPRQGEVNR